MEKKKQRKLVFAVNGERFELSSVDPSTTLLEFLRYETHYRGVKLGCGEGGCGACVVLKSTYDPIHELVEEHAVSSCLTLLCSINFCSITTTEGLGNSRDGFHSIHQRFSGFHASQCGFCTPGMCMSLFSALVNADKTERPNPPTGFSKLIVSEAEKAISGNICRCTGYRPIVDACKSFAADVDMEDLGLNSFWRKWGGLDVNVSVLPFYSRDGICTFPDFLKKEIKSSSNCFSNSLPKNLDVLKVSHLDVVCNNEDKSLTQCNWYSPISVEEVQDHLLKSEGAECGNRVKLVVGNTGAGVYKESYHYNKYIDLRNIPELSVMKRDSMGIVIGAAVTISDAIIALKEEKGLYQSNTRLVFTKIADHMDKVASQFIRNTASLGGNLIMAQRNAFPSDIATVLLAAGSLVNIHTGLERLVITLEEFLEQPPCNSKTILLSVRIPSWDSVRTSFSETTDSKGCKPVEETRLLFETYRAAPRPLGNAVAYLNAAFLTQICTCKMSGDLILKNLQLSFGAYGNKHAIRAKKVEEFLSGKSVTVAVLLEAIRLLKVTVVPEEGTSHSAYRSSLAVGFLYNFLCPFVKCLEEPLKDLSINISDAASSKIPKTGLKGHINAPANKASAADHLDRFDHLERPTSLLAAKQVVELSREYYPVGEPTKKVGAEIQASGEAIYVDDIPSPKDCLYGAFIYSTRPLARVKGIEFNCTSESQRIIAVISVNDIPRGGKNIGSASIFGSEPLFADDLTQYAGQPLSFVIAETQKHANMAANSAKVDYDTKNVGQPILSVEEAVERSSFFEVPSFLKPTQVGDFAKGMLEADHKIVTAKIKLGSQYYFYMETQTALAVPDEDNCMVVYSSIQCPELAQDVIAKCLGIPNHNVRVITRRVGGGFGGKAMKSLPVATACALAAYKLRRPIRIYLDRKTDMIMAGGRHPMKINYTVGFKANGKITALHIDLLINAGISEDVSPIMPHNIVGALKKYDWGALSISAKVCKTNFSSKSAMRAPGEVQGTLIAEAIIEHVASYLSVETDSIRKKNLHTFKSLKLFYGDGAGEPLEYTLPSVLDELAVSSSFHHRADVIRQFNGCNKWRKRGISCIPIVHEVRLRPTPGKVSILNDGSVAVEVGGIELGQGLWTKVKQMAAFALGQLWSDGSLDLLERVRVIQADTLSMVQGGFTAGSTTSESSCEAVRLACNVLIERLTPLKESLQEKDTVSWDTLILQANLQAVNLSASAYWVPDFSSMQYLNYGAAVSEVEIDLLTGATTMLQTDITYDCGQSLNPAVDLGQIEGAFVQGIGFFMLEEYLTNSDGLVVSDSTWTYKVPTVDTIPKQFNVKLLNSGHHQKRVLSSKASGEPPLLLAVSIYCATREAIKDARKEYLSSSGLDGSSSKFHLEVPATMPVVKELCGLDNVERYLESLLAHQ